MNVFTETGIEVALVDPPLGKGGEGAVYRLAGYPGKVAKIYLDPADAAQRKEKIEAMASICDRFDRPDAPGMVAWPLGAFYADPAARRFVGFGMREVATPINIDALYEYPPDPRAGFSMADKLRVVESVARLTDFVHACGQVIGDYNDNNVSVLRGGEAAFVDVDSFHASIGGRTFPCAVCMPGYAAPEVLRNMHGFRTYEECTKETFTEKTDDWALAVLAFRTLFNGVHPYHCLALPDANGSLPAVLPVDKRVERGDTPFFKQVAGTKLPPFAPDAGMLPPYLREPFERAFVAGHADPSQRPSALEWQQAIARYRLEVVRCGSDPTHWHHRSLGACPYCEADANAQRAWSGSGRTRANRTGAKPRRTAPAAAASTAAAPPAGAGATAAVHTLQAGARTLRTGAPAFASKRLSRTSYRMLTFTLAATASAALALLTPLPAVLYTLALGWYEPWMQALAIASGIAGTCLYNHLRATDDSFGTCVLAVMSALAGIAGVALALALLAALAELALSMMSGLAVGIFLIILLLGLLNG